MPMSFMRHFRNLRENIQQKSVARCDLCLRFNAISLLRSQDKSGHEKIDRIMEQYSEEEQYKIMSLYANIMDALQENPGQDF